LPAERDLRLDGAAEVAVVVVARRELRLDTLGERNAELAEQRLHGAFAPDRLRRDADPEDVARQHGVGEPEVVRLVPCLEPHGRGQHAARKAVELGRCPRVDAVRRACRVARLADKAGRGEQRVAFGPDGPNG
jgi:hypothetical protein